MTQNIVVASRFNGPPASGNGGYSCGLFALHVGTEAEVTLRAPVPLDTPMRVVRDDPLVEFYDGDTLIAQAKPAAVGLEAPPPVPFEDAVSVSRPHDDHPYPTCFVCGQDNDDGLHVYTGAVPGRAVAAAPWIPAADLVADDGTVRPEFIWAALDCPGGWVFDVLEHPLRDRVLLGRLAARIDAPVHPGERCVVVAWIEGGEGRKWRAGTALYGDDSSLRAIAHATWIVVSGA